MIQIYYYYNNNKKNNKITYWLKKEFNISQHPNKRKN